MTGTEESHAKHALHALETHLRLSISRHPETRAQHLAKAQTNLEQVRNYRRELSPSRRLDLSNLIQEAGSVEATRSLLPSYNPTALLASLGTVPAQDKLECVRLMERTIKITPHAWQAYADVMLTANADQVLFISGLYPYFEFLTPAPGGITLASYLAKDNPTKAQVAPFHALAMSHSRTLPPAKAVLVQRALLSIS